MSQVGQLSQSEQTKHVVRHHLRYGCRICPGYHLEDKGQKGGKKSSTLAKHFERDHPDIKDWDSQTYRWGRRYLYSDNSTDDRPFEHSSANRMKIRHSRKNKPHSEGDGFDQATSSRTPGSGENVGVYDSNAVVEGETGSTTPNFGQTTETYGITAVGDEEIGLLTPEMEQATRDYNSMSQFFDLDAATQTVISGTESHTSSHSDQPANFLDDPSMYLDAGFGSLRGLYDPNF